MNYYRRRLIEAYKGSSLFSEDFEPFGFGEKKSQHEIAEINFDDIENVFIETYKKCVNYIQEEYRTYGNNYKIDINNLDSIIKESYESSKGINLDKVLNTFIENVKKCLVFYIKNKKDVDNNLLDRCIKKVYFEYTSTIGKKEEPKQQIFW